MPKTKSEIWQAADLKHHMHPFTDGRELQQTGVRVITRADGVYLWDADGNQILDGMAGLWCVNVGYGRASMVEAASTQMSELPYYNTFFRTTTPPAVELAERISELTPGPLNHVFFTNSGSEAVDTVIKLVRFVSNLQGKPDKKLIIARDYSYHGVTMASASLSGLTDMHPQSDLPLAGMSSHIEGCYWYQLGKGLSAEEYGLKAARALEDRILQLGPERVAAFIGEPVYGAGGVMVPPDTYWPEINRICRKYDVLLIADEVVCGFGRTGNWFGSHTFGIETDIITFAKGLSSGYLPVAGLAVHDRLARQILEDGGEWVHGFTYSGHPTCCAVARENLRILTEERLVERVRDDIGPYFQAGLASLADHPLVGEVRGVGLLGAVELVEDKSSHQSFSADKAVGRICREHALQRGLIIRAVRDSNVSAPPFVISHDEVDLLVSRWRDSLDATLKDVSRT